MKKHRINNIKDVKDWVDLYELIRNKLIDNGDAICDALEAILKGFIYVSGISVGVGMITFVMVFIWLLTDYPLR